MINEHDIKDFMDRANEAVADEDRAIDMEEDGGDLVLNFDKFLLAYTKELFKLWEQK